VIDLIKVIGTGAVALAIIGAVVIGGQDTTYLVPPPQAVAESFTRAIAARRYDRAMAQVDPQSGITAINARLGGEALHERSGSIENVEGDPGVIAGDYATASAVLTTEKAGRVRYFFKLTRTGYLWKIVEWSDR
jgi:hypothetical protein